MAGLRLKQERFVAEYLKDGNATQAAKRAGYSPRTASVIGYETLNLPHVSAELEARRAALAAKKEVTIESLSDMFVEDRALAREVKQMSAAVSAVDKLARLHGLMIDRSESKNLNLVRDLTDQELADIIQSASARKALDDK